MLKRLLSLSLAALLALSALVPLTAIAADGEEVTYPSISANDYNALYVQDGLVFQVDFFKTNSYWNTNGTDYTMPVSPSEDDAYWYDANKDGVRDEGEVYNFTSLEARSCYRVITRAGSTCKFYEDGKEVTTPTVEYKTAAEAEAAIKTFPALPDGKAYEVFYGANNAFLAASSAWQKAEKEFLSSFFIKNYESLFTLYSYAPALAAGRTDYEHNSNTQHSAFTIEDGYLKMRYDYHSSGGMQMGGLGLTPVRSDALSLQVITKFGEDATNGSPILFLNARPTAVFDVANSRVTFTGFTSNSAFLMSEGASIPAVSLSTSRVEDVTLTLNGSSSESTGDDSFTMRTQDGLLFTTPGTISGFQNMMYYGWSSSAKGGEVYAYRYYNTELTDAEIRQNHLADLCKWFRLDISSLVSGGKVKMGADDIITLSILMAEYTIGDDRATVAAAFDSAVNALKLTGEGAAFETFNAAVAAGKISAAAVRAMPAEYHDRIFTDFKRYYDANPAATPQMLTAEIDAIIDDIFMTDFLEHYIQTPYVSADDFFGNATGLSDAAKHFYTVASTFNLELADLVEAHEIVREFVYESFADVHPDILQHTTVLNKRLSDTVKEYSDRYYGNVASAELISFRGYQLHLSGDPAVRSVFEIDTAVLSALEAKGYTVTIGLLFKTTSNAGMEVEKTANGWDVIADSPANKLDVYKTGSGFAVETLSFGDDSTCFAYEYASTGSITKLFFSAFVAVEREGSENVVVYTAAESETFSSGVTLRQLATYCREEMRITTPSIQLLCREPLTSVYIQGKSLTSYAVLLTAENSTFIDAFLAEIFSVTGVPMATVRSADETDGPIIRFEKGDFDTICLEGDNLVFTYTTGKITGFTKALENTTAYPVGNTGKTADVVFLYGGQLFD